MEYLEAFEKYSIYLLPSLSESFQPLMLTTLPENRGANFRNSELDHILGTRNLWHFLSGISLLLKRVTKNFTFLTVSVLNYLFIHF